MKTAMPTLPLYKEANNDKTLEKLHPNGNAGLWYDKFCSSWENAKFQKFQKEEWIKTVTNRHCGNSDELKQQRHRHWEMVAKLGGHNLCLKTDSVFVTGLGREHPVENGFLWHHTLGVPYLPGSSVKGMVRAWIEQWADEKDKEEKEEVDRIFGPKQPTEQPQVGAVVFLDAIPLDKVRLKADIMTPHYGEYYQNKKKPEAPGDWISPVPIPFLAVKEDTTFHFAIVPRRQNCLETPAGSGESRGGHRSDCEIVIGWLKDALEWIGAGAKTAVGYGRMSYDKDTQNQCEETYKERHELEEREQKSQEEVEGLPEDVKEVVDIIWRLENVGSDVKSTFLKKMDEFLADKEKLSPEAYRRLSNKMTEFWAGIMENPDAVKGKKKKRIYKERPRNLAKKLNTLCKENTTEGEK